MGEMPRSEQWLLTSTTCLCHADTECHIAAKIEEHAVLLGEVDPDVRREYDPRRICSRNRRSTNSFAFILYACACLVYRIPSLGPMSMIAKRLFLNSCPAEELQASPLDGGSKQMKVCAIPVNLHRSVKPTALVAYH